jgi:hypothetical protein
VRHGPEELVAHQALDYRKPCRQGRDETGGHIVAIDRKAPLGSMARRAGQESGDRRGAVEQCGCEGVLDLVKAWHGSSQAADLRRGREWAVRMVRARAASAASVVNEGTSLSHSISVGIGPVRAIVR